mmetsp:Transcript_8892/g.18816  ORF Transcript_8892/g.18816 Transcript_8892/m.18816 type:complete len:364 (+) Transcript_8892:3668-4759(+)
MSSWEVSIGAMAPSSVSLLPSFVVEDVALAFVDFAGMPLLADDDRSVLPPPFVISLGGAVAAGDSGGTDDATVSVLPISTLSPAPSSVISFSAGEAVAEIWDALAVVSLAAFAVPPSIGVVSSALPPPLVLIPLLFASGLLFDAVFELRAPPFVSDASSPPFVLVSVLPSILSAVTSLGVFSAEDAVTTAGGLVAGWLSLALVSFVVFGSSSDFLFRVFIFILSCKTSRGRSSKSSSSSSSSSSESSSSSTISISFFLLVGIDDAPEALASSSFSVGLSVTANIATRTAVSSFSSPSVIVGSAAPASTLAAPGLTVVASLSAAVDGDVPLDAALLIVAPLIVVLVLPTTLSSSAALLADGARP